MVIIIRILFVAIVGRQHIRNPCRRTAVPVDVITLLLSVYGFEIACDMHVSNQQLFILYAHARIFIGGNKPKSPPHKDKKAPYIKKKASSPHKEIKVAKRPRHRKKIFHNKEKAAKKPPPPHKEKKVTKFLKRFFVGGDRLLLPPPPRPHGHP